jgi:hypothetical protein
MPQHLSAMTPRRVVTLQCADTRDGSKIAPPYTVHKSPRTGACVTTSFCEDAAKDEWSIQIASTPRKDSADSAENVPIMDNKDSFKSKGWMMEEAMNKSSASADTQTGVTDTAYIDSQAAREPEGERMRTDGCVNLHDTQPPAQRSEPVEHRFFGTVTSRETPAQAGTNDIEKVPLAQAAEYVTSHINRKGSNSAQGEPARGGGTHTSSSVYVCSPSKPDVNKRDAPAVDPESVQVPEICAREGGHAPVSTQESPTKDSCKHPTSPLVSSNAVLKHVQSQNKSRGSQKQSYVDKVNLWAHSSLQVWSNSQPWSHSVQSPDASRRSGRMDSEPASKPHITIDPKRISFRSLPTPSIPNQISEDPPMPAEFMDDQIDVDANTDPRSLSFRSIPALLPNESTDTRHSHHIAVPFRSIAMTHTAPTLENAGYASIFAPVPLEQPLPSRPCNTSMSAPSSMHDEVSAPKMLHEELRKSVLIPAGPHARHQLEHSVSEALTSSEADETMASCHENEYLASIDAPNTAPGSLGTEPSLAQRHENTTYAVCPDENEPNIHGFTSASSSARPPRQTQHADMPNEFLETNNADDNAAARTKGAQTALQCSQEPTLGLGIMGGMSLGPDTETVTLTYPSDVFNNKDVTDENSETHTVIRGAVGTRFIIPKLRLWEKHSKDKNTEKSAEVSQQVETGVYSADSNMEPSVCNIPKNSSRGTDEILTESPDEVSHVN